ncbi:hypothetical protein NXH64_09400 [Butyrivibrio fibrisolvens]|uniref:hypothetical protein n=1 Tax=Pseudobutyrivibrio ruminis TaxID=46206 RepID=UPI0004242BD5|nr:hypothetical protein [Pseudobutyrivibrio ruminis]MDC7279716.1 hypothetical protein [Butyrivibrio fibrisolvens]
MAAYFEKNMLSAASRFKCCLPLQHLNPLEKNINKERANIALSSVALFNNNAIISENTIFASILDILND